VTSELEKPSALERMLAEASTVDDAMNVIDYAEAARVFAQRAKLGTSAVNHATTVKIRAERRLADMVDEGQRAGQIATRGGDRKSNPDGRGLIPTVKEVGVNDRRLSEARVLRDAYTDDGLLALAAAADAKDRELSRKELVKQASRERRIEVKRARVEQIRKTDAGPLELLSDFPVLYVDPPWRYEHSETSTREIENHYPTMALDELKKLEAPAADDSVLFLWVTSPKLVEGIELLGAWGFEYRTSMVWVKDKIGMGYYARQQHELLLIGKRGLLPVPDPEDRPSSVIEGPRGEHSAKPDVVYELIERMYPLRDKCEMFQRRPRAGWVGWGNQA
jgi:N6-adenosine-specific RNA methylase IME4